LAVCGKQYLVDCGMEQGIDIFENVPIPVPANAIEAVFLTHAQIAALHGTSGHADQAGLLRWLSGFREKPQTVFVNHGDDASCVISQKLLAQMGYNAEAPSSGTEYDLHTGRMTVYTDAKQICSLIEKWT